MQPSKRICVIGGGPAGLAVLKVLADTPAFQSEDWTATVFEARDNVGGIWLPAPPTDDPPLTPLYDSLTTNLPHPVMCFPTFPFPPSTPLFPRASVVQTYLEDYARHFGLMRFVELKAAVRLAEWNADTQHWQVTITKGDVSRLEKFDHIVVANGHYRLPRLPSTRGLERWLTDGRASHAVTYRHPLSEYRDKTILVVGAGPSGSDISAELRGFANVVLHSVTGGVPTDPKERSFKLRGRVTEYHNDGSVLFEDGTHEQGIDHCILATGYDFSFPFLPWLRCDLPDVGASPTMPLTNSGFHVFPLARQVFALSKEFAPGALAFMGLPLRVAPFPLLEAQARAFVHVISRPAAFDVEAEVTAVRERAEALRSRFDGDACAVAKSWHVTADQEQFDYRDALNTWAAPSTTGGDKVSGWVPEMYAAKGTLRAQWRDLERLGLAEEWVRDVGKGGEEEWVALMRRLLDRARFVHDKESDSAVKEP